MALIKQLKKKTSDFFIENVSLPVIEQLLDHLLHDDVLNSGEGQAIIEAHDTRARRARILIDSVSRKGDEASWKMITYLQQRDPMNISNPQTIQYFLCG
uniref:Caspase-1-A-like n=1 Tax=Hippocampus comes TaxID=109280 RepID=A0A3Q2XH95_HIPCM